MEINVKDILGIDEIPMKQFNAQSINSIKRRYPKERKDSKAPTFALT